MPIYEYVCSTCQKLSDVLQKVDEPAPRTCPACGAEGTLARVVSRTSFVLKGGGWGADLYGSPKKSGEAASPAGETNKPVETKKPDSGPAADTGSSKPDKPASGS
jgi:putative FmdB family regulatory protein